MKTSLFAENDLWEVFKNELLSWKHTPYLHLGKVKGRGVDCTLYVALCLKEIGILKEITHEYYPPDWFLRAEEEFVLDSFRRHIRKNLQSGFEILEYSIFNDCLPERKDFVRGDVLCFKLKDSKVTTHTAVWLDDNVHMINAINQSGVQYQTYGSWWHRRLTTLFRVVKG